MLVFISWSTSRSHEVALALREWLPRVLPGVEPWVSSEDIAKGTRWSPEIAHQLERADYGIVCVVAENLLEPWLLFESGAMSKSVDAGRVAPLLLGVSSAALPGPLAQFQCTVAEEGDMRRLIDSINRAPGGPAHPDSDLTKRFADTWPELQCAFAVISRSTSPPRIAAAGHGAAARQQRTAEIAEQWASSELIRAREAYGSWKAIKSATVNTIGALIRLPELMRSLRQLVEFICNVGALGRMGMLDRELAQSTFGTEMIRLCHELEGGPKSALAEIWDDWFSRVQPLVEKTRKYLEGAEA